MFRTVPVFLAAVLGLAAAPLVSAQLIRDGQSVPGVEAVHALHDQTKPASAGSLNAPFQKLQAQATSAGLWLGSTETGLGNSAQRPFRVRAASLGRAEAVGQRLAAEGKVMHEGEGVRWVRPGVTEEYTASMDGVRQDFVLGERLAGSGKVELGLEVTDAEARPDQDSGVMLALPGSGREIIYGSLKVLDARGRELPATMSAPSAQQIRIEFDDTGAVYPVRVDPTFSDADWISLNSGIPGANAEITAMAVDSAGILYVAGKFTFIGNVASSGVARWDGGSWTTMGTTTIDRVWQIVPFGFDVYIGGAFNDIGGAPGTGYIAKWSGNAWFPVGVGAQAGTNDEVFALSVMGSRLFVGGRFTRAGGVNRTGIAAWDGVSWSSVGSLSNGVTALANDGTTLYASGYFSTADSTTVNRIAKWNANAWTPLGTGLSGGDGYATELAFVAGSLYAAGNFTLAGGVSANKIARWNGSAWSAMGTGFTSAGAVVNALISHNGELYAGGSFTGAGGTSAPNLVKWNGSAWSAVGGGSDSAINALATSASGYLYVGGQLLMAGNVPVARVARWYNNLWTAVGPAGISGSVRAMLMVGTDMYVGGDFTTIAGQPIRYLAKWNGTSWSQFGSGVDGPVRALATDSSGDIHVGGNFSSIGGISAGRIASYRIGTGTWVTYGSGMDGPVYCIHINGGVYVGGDFDQGNGANCRAVGYWDGSTWRGQTGAGTSWSVYSMASRAGNMYVGGYLGGGPSIASISGGNASPIYGGPEGSVYAMTVMNDEVYAAGSFSTAAEGSVTAENMVRYSGNRWYAVGSGIGGAVYSMIARGSELFVGGSFEVAGGVQTKNLARWNGGVWAGFGTGLDGPVSTLAIDGNNRLYVGGDFVRGGSTVSPFFIAAPIQDGPEIQVEQPSPAVVQSGGGRSYGYVNVGSSASLTFTIKNIGNQNLTGLVVSKSGAHASDFTVMNSPSSTLPGPTGATSLIVRFAPTAGGVRSAMLHIDSNDGDEGVFNIALNGTGLTPEIVVEQPAGVELVDGGSLDFGNALLGAEVSRTFTLKNTGNVSLEGILVSKDGSHPADFFVTTAPAASVAVGGSTSFTVRFKSTAAGIRTANLHIASNDFDENPFDLSLTGGAVMPEITVEQPLGSDVPSGGSRSFGNVYLGGSQSMSFTLRNTGTDPLVITGTSLSGTNQADFVVTQFPAGQVAAGGSTTCTVNFTPSALGPRSALLRISSWDLDEPVFDINLGGAGALPEIEVEQPAGSGLADGGSRDFGSVHIGLSTSLDFVIKNTGTYDLTGLAITIDGTNASDFIVITHPLTSVGAGGSMLFTVKFAPQALGARTANLHIANNDTNENPFDLVLTGTGTQPEIEVRFSDGTEISDGGSRDFGTASPGSNVTRSITIKNIGTANLTGITLMWGSGGSGDFEITSSPTIQVVPGGSTSFNVRLVAKHQGPLSALLQIVSSDTDENPFDIHLSGTGSLPEIAMEQPAGVDLAGGGSRDFGAVEMGSEASLHFTIKNTGTASLVSGLPSVGGTNAGDFSLTAWPATSVGAGSSTTFTVRFRPTSLGTRTATLSLSNSDVDEGFLTFNLSGTGAGPEIAVEQPAGTAIADGASLDWGDQTVELGSVRTFTLKSLGSVNLTNIAVTVYGPQAAAFTVTVNPESTVVAGGSTIFRVSFDPTVAGAHAAALHIASNDADENPYDITLLGTGLVPDIRVETPGVEEIVNGGTYDFSSAQVGQAVSRTLKIKNMGQGILKFGQMSDEGVHKDEFSVPSYASDTVSRGGTSDWPITFTPAGPGLRTTTVTIYSNDPDEDPYQITLTGTGLQGEIAVEQPANTAVTLGDSRDFGDVPLGEPATMTFTLRNTGSAPLKNVALTLVGPQSSEFQVTVDPAPTVAAEGSTSFQIEFDPLVTGRRTATLRIASSDGDENPYDITLTGTGVKGELTVEQPVGTPVEAGTGRDFGTVIIGAESSMTFTIKNTGTGPLTLSPRLRGMYLNQGDFKIAAMPASPLAAQQNTSLTVIFKPTFNGARLADLQLMDDGDILTNDPVIPLTGNGVPSLVSFDRPLYYAHQGDTEAEITLTRTNAGAPVMARYIVAYVGSTKAPPLTAAVSGTDYPQAHDDWRPVFFQAGESQLTVKVSLIPQAFRAKTNLQMGLLLSQDIVGGPTPQRIFATLRILGEDTAKPTLTVKSPAAGKVSGLLPLMVTGTAGDVMGLDRVEVKLNDEDPVRASLQITSSTQPTEVPFTSPLEPVEGLNVVVVTAYDLHGKSTSETRKFTFTRRQMLSLAIKDASNPAGAAAGGTVVMTVTPAASASALIPGGNAYPTASNVVPGAVVKLVAKPAKGYVFSRWTPLSGAGVVLNKVGDMVTFAMPDVDTAVQAEFVLSPFAVASSFTSGVHWLMSPEAPPEGEPAFAYQGYLSGAVTTTGSFTGKLLMNGQTVPVTATIFGDGPALFTVAGQKRDSLPVPGGQLRLYPDMTATITSAAGDVLVASEGLRALAKAPAGLLNSATKGTYTMRLSPVVPSPVPMEASKYPQGFGYATMTLSNAGMIALAGVLADGTSVTMASALLHGSVAPLFVQLTTPGATTKLGLLTGLLGFDAAPATTDMTADLTWYRPATTNPKVLLYQAGWPNGIHLDAAGALYSATRAFQSVLFPGLTANTASPARLYFTGGKLAAPVEKLNFGLKANAVVKTVPVDGAYALTLTPSTGHFSGTFTPNWSNPVATRPAFKGVILQKGVVGSAAGFFLNNAKNETAQESGAATLGAP